MKKIVMGLLAAMMLIAFGVKVGSGELIKEEDTHMMEMGVITLNLLEPKHYVKMGLAYSYEGKKNEEKLGEKIDAFKDVVIRNLIHEPKDSFLDVALVSEKKELIRSEMNRVMGEEMIGEVFLTELRVGK